MTIEELREQAAEAHAKAVAIQNKADGERRQLTAEEADAIAALDATFDQLVADIERRQRLDDQAARLSQSQGRTAAPVPVASGNAAAPVPAGAGARATHNSARDQQRWGFSNFGEYCAAVRAGAARGASPDLRLIQNAAASTYGTEGAGADGGFAVPPEWRAQIMQLVSGEGTVLQLTDQQTVSGNSITYPVDETTDWQTSGGILGYWGKEAVAATQSKPALQLLTLRLEKLQALVPMTEELLEDAPAMAGYVSAKAGRKISAKMTDAILNGDGAGMPLGMLNAPCKVTVSKESSQAAATIVAANILKMYSRMPAANRNRAYWFINQDIEPMLMNLNITFRDLVGSAGIAAGAAAYLPPGGLSSTPYATLMGRPILALEACQTLGTEGDILFADPGAYLTILKSNGVRSDVSMHLWFDQDLTAFKFTLRANGMPWLSAPITRKNGSNTLSTVVTLQTR